MSNAIARRLEAIQAKGAMRSSKGKALPRASTEKQLLDGVHL